MTQISNEYGSWCGTFVVPSPYIVNCGYASGFMILQHIYGDITYADSSKFIADNVRTSSHVTRGMNHVTLFMAVFIVHEVFSI